MSNLLDVLRQTSRPPEEQLADSRRPGCSGGNNRRSKPIELCRSLLRVEICIVRLSRARVVGADEVMTITARPATAASLPSA
jgi:hypothetical protein